MKKLLALFILCSLIRADLKAVNSNDNNDLMAGLMSIPAEELKSAPRSSLIKFGTQAHKKWTNINEVHDMQGPDSFFDNMTKYGYKTKIRNSPYIFRYIIWAGAFTGAGYVVCDPKFNVLDSIEMVAHVGGAYPEIIYSDKKRVFVGCVISSSSSGGVVVTSYQMHKYEKKKFVKIMDINFNIYDPDSSGDTGGEIKILREKSGVCPKILIESVTCHHADEIYMTAEEWVYDGNKYAALPKKKKPLSYEEANAFMIRTQNHGYPIKAVSQ